MVALSRNSGRKEFQFVTEYLHIYYEEHVTSGHVGKTLWVDLSEGMIHEEELDDSLTSARRGARMGPDARLRHPDDAVNAALLRRFRPSRGLSPYRTFVYGNLR
jgi:hypothetical protein